jgi:hypothetical protein
MSNGNGNNPLDQSIVDSPQLPQPQLPQPIISGQQQLPVTPTAPLSSNDLNDQINALIKGGNRIQMPSQAPDPTDIAGTAQYNAIQLAKSMQDAGTPMSREQFRTAVTGQYDALLKQNVERAQEIFKAGLDVQTEAAKRALPRNLDATNADQLASYADSFDSLNKLGELHDTAAKAGFGNYLAAASPLVNTSPEAIKFNSYRDAILGKIARGIGGDTRVDNKDLDIARNFLPNLGDSPAVAKAKIAILQQHVTGVMGRQLEFYKNSGFNVGAIQQGPYATMKAQADAGVQKVNGAPGPDLASQTAAHANTAARLTAATSRLAQSNAVLAAQQKQQQSQPPQLQQPPPQ